MRGRLFVLSGPDVGRSFDLRHGDTFGRSPDCIVTLRHASVSRRHAHVEVQDDEFWIVDDASRNGVKAGGERVERLLLADHMEFVLGDLSLRFRVESSEPSAAPTSAAASLEATAWSAAPVLPPPSSGLAAEVADWDDGITIEEADEIEIAPARAAPRPELDSSTPQAEGRRVLQYHRVPNQRGFAITELSQHPAWVRWSVYTLAVALTVTLFFAAFKGTAFLKSKSRGPASTEATSD